MLRPALCLSFVLALTACGGKDSDSGTAPTSGTPPVLPLEGTWNVTLEQKFSDSCDPVSNQFQAPVITIALTGANTFDLSENTGANVGCTITNGVDVACEESTSTWTSTGGAMSDVIFREAEMISESEMDLRFNVEIDCEGAGCNNYGAYQGVGWPCDFVQRSTATHAGR